MKLQDKLNELNRLHLKYNPNKEINYADYISCENPIWKRRRELYKLEYGDYCKRCNQHLPNSPFQLHHKNYLNLGFELFTDLEWICKSCHDALHLEKKLYDVYLGKPVKVYNCPHQDLFDTIRRLNKRNDTLHLKLRNWYGFRTRLPEYGVCDIYNNKQQTLGNLSKYVSELLYLSKFHIAEWNKIFESLPDSQYKTNGIKYLSIAVAEAEQIDWYHGHWFVNDDDIYKTIDFVNCKYTNLQHIADEFVSGVYSNIKQYNFKHTTGISIWMFDFKK